MQDAAQDFEEQTGAPVDPPAPPAAGEPGSVADRTAPGPHGPVDVRVYVPDGAPASAFVWAHGGGFAVGDLDMPESHAVAGALQRAGHLVVAVGYRLAAEGTRWPVPSDDVLAAWRWGRDLAAAAGVDAARTFLGGASAGGNLAAGAVLRLLEAGEAPPAGVVLAYPTLHAVPPAASPAAVRALGTLPPGEERWEPPAVRAMYAGYVGADPDGAPAAVTPGTAPLEGFPPVLVLVSEADGLRGSAEDFAARLVGAGVPVTCVLERGTRHGHLNRDEQGARASLRRIDTWLRAAPALAGPAV
ncbi:alpha/beta hydrolase fold domain-containing protein [Kineococcus sp. SYSU DK005]|uniref:alpha/beta hydrolase fold domain-containing protein n=1 Tax=Kineococcus sp. SYSU DK005 TaxID=3383126 RepID=UPI003D7EA26D